MAKVTITFEDTEAGVASNVNVLDPGRPYAEIQENPTSAEVLGLACLDMLKAIGGQVGHIVDDAEYHAKDRAHV